MIHEDRSLYSIFFIFSDLLRCWLGFYVVAIVAFLLSFIFGQVLVCKATRRPKFAYTASLLAFMAGKDIYGIFYFVQKGPGVISMYSPRPVAWGFLLGRGNNFVDYTIFSPLFLGFIFLNRGIRDGGGGQHFWCFICFLTLP